MNIPKPYMPRFQPPVYCCRKAAGTLELDGRLDKPFWQSAPFTQPFVDIEGRQKEAPRFDTRVKMLWDEENLYIGAELEGDEIWATMTERDSVIFYDNDFEIFLNPSCSTHAYYEFEMNALNTVWDLLLTKPYLSGGFPVNAFDIAGLKTAVHIDGVLNDPGADNKKWSVEIIMPFDVLMQCRHPTLPCPQPGDYWRMNFSRVQWDVDIIDGKYVKRINPATNAPYPENNWVYAPTGIVNIHYPELWAFLFFTENDETYGIPENEKISWELRKVFYNLRAYFEEHGCYTNEFASVSEGYSYHREPLIETTRHGFELSLATEDGSEIMMFADGYTEISSPR